MRSLETTTAAALVLAALVITAACGNSTSPSPVSPSSTTSAASAPGPSSNRAEVSGKISSINAAARSLVVASTTVVVPAAAALSSSSGQVEFKDLQVEMEVHVVGTMEDNVLKAQEVQVDDHGSDRQPDPAGENETEFTGPVLSIAGRCPDLTLSINGKTVKTSTATSFLKAACSALGSKDIVEVKGTVQADGSVMAARVQVEDDVAEPEPPENEVEFTGLVSSVSGGCPQLDLTVAGRGVKSTSATEFKNGSCGDVKANSTMLEVKGMAASNGMVTATRLKFEK